MAKSRWNYAARVDTSNSSATSDAVFNLTKNGFLEELHLTIGINPTASTNPAVRVKDFIKNISLRSGGKTLISLRGNEIKAFETYLYNPSISSLETNQSAVLGYDTFILPLARPVNGKWYAPDMSKWKNPQVFIQWDSNITKTDMGMFVDADTTPATSITVLEKIYEGTGKYAHGVVKQSEVKVITQAASQTSKVDVGIDKPLVGVMITGGYGDTNFTDDHADIEFSFDGGSWVPLHIYANEYAKWQESIFGNPFSVSFRCDVANAINQDLYMGRVTGFSAGSLELTSTTSVILISLDDAIPKLGHRYDASVADGTYSLYSLQVDGYLPYHSFYVPMWAFTGGEKDTVDPSEFKTLTITTVSGSGANTSSRPRIVAEYLDTDVN